jgi:hypothetical protein
MEMTKIERAVSRDQWLDRLAAHAAEMAGYDINKLPSPYNGGSKDEGALWLGFRQKAQDALERLAPRSLDEKESAEFIPEELYARESELYHFVRAVREWRGMTVAELALRSGLSIALIEAIEARQIVPSRYQEIAVAHALNVASECVTDWPQVLADAASLKDEGYLEPCLRA